MEKIIIRDAYEHNLKHLNLEIPLNSFTCVTGCSGCGKSSLVFDTIYTESQRGFLEGMTGHLYGQKLMNKPRVGAIENLQPALNISQNYYNINPRSTLGTITDISYYLRSLFAILNSNQSHNISENTFSSNNPKTFCPQCSGTGVERVVSESLLIPDSEKTLRNGAILFYKGAPESKEQKLLEALCERYGIDIEKKISELSKQELHQLLYADEQIRYKLAYKEGKRRKQHYVDLRGAIPAIQDRTSSDSTDKSAAYAKYMEEVPCHICHGAKLRQEVLQYEVNGLNYNDAESLELTALSLWLNDVDNKYQSSAKKELVTQLVDGMQQKIAALLKLKVGYLCLKRSVPSLSDGERQRIRIATQLTCSLKGLIYILDEPCKGLHYRDIGCIIQVTKDLINRGNTVISIEHNKQYIAAADTVIELGPVGGPCGGYLIDSKCDVNTQKKRLIFKKNIDNKQFFKIEDINFRNIKGQTVRFPIGGITCITGTSGSGKSTLATVILNCISTKSFFCCKKVHGASTIKRAIQVNQAPIGKTPRSTVVSYLGIFDEIRSLYAKTATAKKMKLSTKHFSMNVKGGRCECCKGTGMQKIELNYLPSSYILCPECGGKRFNDNILAVTYKDKTILDILETPISELMDIFKKNHKIYSVLQSMEDLGLGYLRLGQMSMNLSGGEAQRIKLAKALGTPSHGKVLYILDEPTSGLNDVDIDKFIRILQSLQNNGDTIIIIEHNLRFVSQVADYIIDFGLANGEAGGIVSAQGDPKSVFLKENSSLYGLDKINI